MAEMLRVDAGPRAGLFLGNERGVVAHVADDERGLLVEVYPPGTSLADAAARAVEPLAEWPYVVILGGPAALAAPILPL